MPKEFRYCGDNTHYGKLPGADVSAVSATLNSIPAARGLSGVSDRPAHRTPLSQDILPHEPLS